MKICIAALSKDVDSEISPELGKSVYFLVFDSETGKIEVMSNTGLGAGSALRPNIMDLRAARILVRAGVHVLITGGIRKAALEALTSAGVTVVIARGRVREVLMALGCGREPCEAA
ncbi:MAG: NifB/NifX family molybdenum-iron cluster-binding protein [Candidatus Alkanophagales archaeon]